MFDNPLNTPSKWSPKDLSDYISNLIEQNDSTLRPPLIKKDKGSDFDIDKVNFSVGSIDNVKKVKPYSTWKRIMVISDLHLPFEHGLYLSFCKELRDAFNPDGIVFIGDIIDHHYTSFHNPDPDGMSAGDELVECLDRVQDWYKEFPNALVMIGNHDARVFRIAKESRISKTWIRDYKDVLNTPNWEFMEEVIIDNVLYTHGSSGDAYRVATNRMISTVQGHYHTKMGVQYINNRVWGMQVGCGIDRDSYAMSYAKGYSKEPMLGAGHC
jgi:metallophosphoesterase superfamily enzyme